MAVRIPCADAAPTAGARTAVKPHPPLPPPAPASASHFRSDDLDEVRAFVRGSDGEHSRVAHRAGALGFEIATLRGPAVTVGWSRAAVEKTIRGAVQPHLLHLSVPAGSRYCFGREEHLTGAGTATFVPGGWEFSPRSPAGDAFGFCVHGRRLIDEIAARRPTGRGEAVQQGRAVEHAPAVAARRLATVEAWIDAHLEEPITIGRLCQVAGVGERAVQKAFESRRGLSPMRFVTERRLEAARRLLENTAPDGGVTDVAMRLGFRLGRVAGLYRGVFGESPSQTLARARR